MRRDLSRRLSSRKVLLLRAAPLWAALLLALLGLFGRPAPSLADPAQEYGIKASFLHNFLSFTEWPEGTGSRIELCIYGPDPFGPQLDRLAGKKAGERVLGVRRINSVSDMERCDAVFITRAVIGNLPRVLDSLGRRPVLTLADTPGAMQQGVAINMVEGEQGKLGFEVNLTAVRNQGLNLSIRLLRLAREVRR